MTKLGALLTSIVLAATLIPLGADAGPTDMSPVLRRWVARYNGPTGKDDRARAIAVSPDGRHVYVTGESHGDGSDYVTVAYESITGRVRWTARYSSPGINYEAATAMTLSPDGRRVYVTGATSVHFGKYTTIAYDSGTGEALWVADHEDTESSSARPVAIVASRDGRRLFVTGTASGAQSRYLTVAHDTRDGSVRWVARYEGARAYAWASAVAVSHDGARVFVTGGAYRTLGEFHYATVAYDARDGTQLWVSGYGAPGSSEFATSLTLDPDGSHVYVTGTSWTEDATVGYDSATGAQLWVARNAGRGSVPESKPITISPDGTTVYVAGSTWVGESDIDYATTAYDACTGARVWEARYQGPSSAEDFAVDIAVPTDGRYVYVTGASVVPENPASQQRSDYATVAYHADSGAEAWSVRHELQPGESNAPSAMALSRGGDRLYVTGHGRAVGYSLDYITVAYRTLASFERVSSELVNVGNGQRGGYGPVGSRATSK